MTVQDNANFVDYVANGAQTSFAFNFRVDSGLWVTIDFMDDISGVVLNIDQDINPGGSVDYLVAPPNLTAIHIQRVTPQTQDTNYGRHDPFDSETNEDNLDKLTMIIQDLDEAFDGQVVALQAEIDAIDTTLTAGFAWEFVSVVGDRTLILTDAFKFLQSIDTGGTQDITIPPNSDVAFVLGAQISFEQKGTAVLGFLTGAGVNIDSIGAKTVAAQFGTVTLVQDEIDNWVLLGNETP